MRFRGVLLAVVFCGLVGPGFGQGLSDWFGQNKKRIKDYEEQVAEMEAYLAVAAKGFSVVQSGLTAIQEVKRGEFDLHNAFYTALGEVNPAVSGLAEVAEITALQVATVRQFSAVLSRPGLGADEVAAIGVVYASVVRLCLADVVSLQQVLTAGDLTMSDGDRVSRLDALDASARRRYAFAVSYTNGAALLAGQRTAEAGEMAVLQGLY